ncbi:MAG: hypothetical protein H0S80_00430 [Desulfovibrionaceae bacterium]|nr:hypothetical protein [Desulfovibrionaceae bacterium]
MFQNLTKLISDEKSKKICVPRGSTESRAATHASFTFDKVEYRPSDSFGQALQAKVLGRMAHRGPGRNFNPKKGVWNPFYN